MNRSPAKRPHVAAHRLSNGSRLLTVTDRLLPIVHFTLAFRHGALSDPSGRPGALAMLLPMLLRGTTRRSRSDFHEALESLGSSLDTSVGYELAIVRGAALRQHLPATLALLAEALAEPALAPDALEDLVHEVTEGLLNERDDDDSVAEVFLRRQYYAGTPLARGAVGSARTLRALTPADLQAARGHLCAPWALLALAGDIDAAEAEQVTRPLFAALPQEAPAAPLPPKLPRADEPLGHGPLRAPRVLLVDKPDRTQAQVRVALPGLRCGHADNDAFWLGSVAFGGTFTSPLTKEVRDVRGWSYVAHADYRRRSVFASPLVLRTAPKNADAAACVALQLELLGQLAAGHSELADLARARHYLVGRAPFWSATAFDVLGPALLLEVLGLPLSELWDSKESLLALSLEHVPAVMQRYLAGATPTVVVVGSRGPLEAALATTLPTAELAITLYTDGL